MKCNNILESNFMLNNEILIHGESEGFISTSEEMYPTVPRFKDVAM